MFTFNNLVPSIDVFTDNQAYDGDSFTLTLTATTYASGLSVQDTFTITIEDICVIATFSDPSVNELTKSVNVWITDSISGTPATVTTTSCS